MTQEILQEISVFPVMTLKSAKKLKEKRRKHESKRKAIIQRQITIQVADFKKIYTRIKASKFYPQ